jgi:hypothetical protein
MTEKELNRGIELRSEIEKLDEALLYMRGHNSAEDIVHYTSIFFATNLISRGILESLCLDFFKTARKDLEDIIKAKRKEFDNL